MEHNHVSFFVSIKVTKDVVFVERSQVSVRRDVNLALKLLKAAQDLVSHLN
jgi:hypothetical protein